MTDIPTIFISAYRNISVRYLLYSDIFRELKKGRVRLVVFLQDNDLDYYRQRLGSENVVFEPVLSATAMRQYRTGRVSRFFVITRKCMSGGEPGYSNSTDKAWLYQYGMELSRGVKGRLDFQIIRALAALGSRSSAVRKGLVALESRIFPGEMYDPYFKRYKPRMLVTSSVGYMIDPFFMRAAKRHGCEVVSIPHNWDNPSTKDYRGAEPDHVITWNEIMKREVHVFHDIPNDRIHVGGIAHWDHYFNGRFNPRSREEFLKANDLSLDRKTIFYGASSNRLFERTFDVLEQILQAIQEDRFVHPSQLLVRLHPSYLLKQPGSEGQYIDNYKGRIEAIKKAYGNLVSFRPPTIRVLNDDIDMPMEDMHGLAETLYYSDVLLTEYSTLMIEASIFDLPVINVGLYNFRDTDKPAVHLETLTHIKRILRYGATRNAYTIEELFDYLDGYLNDRSRDQEERRDLIEHEITTNRGCAGKSIGKLLLNLAGVADHVT